MRRVVLCARRGPRGGVGAGRLRSSRVRLVYSIAAFPVTLDLGLGDNFWLTAGTTLGTNPSLGSVPLQYSRFFSTHGRGLQYLGVDLSFAHLVLLSEITYPSTEWQSPPNN